MPSSGGGRSEVQTTEPWSGVAPHLRDLYGRVRGTPGSTERRIVGYEPGAPGGMTAPPPHLGPGAAAFWQQQYGEGGRGQPIYETVTTGGEPGLIDQPMPIFDPVGFMPEELAAQERMRSIAGQGVPGAVGAAGDELERLLSGQYLAASNPYLAAMEEAAARPVTERFTEEILPALTGQFAAAGRGGSGMQASVQRGATEDLTRNLADASTRLYGGAYESERDRMLRGMAMAPQVGTLERQIDLANAGLLGDVGMAQREMEEARNRAEMQRGREPWERLQLAAQLYGAGSPFTSVTEPYYQNRLAGGLGGAVTGGGLGFMAGGPLGAGIGGLAGLGLGLMG